MKPQQRLPGKKICMIHCFVRSAGTELCVAATFHIQNNRGGGSETDLQIHTLPIKIA